jgi:predicted DNA-binding ribbon-helix-helix protein
LRPEPGFPSVAYGGIVRHDTGMTVIHENQLQSPIKRSITIAGHPTSVRLEPVFWSALDAAAIAAALPLNALIAQIDAQRMAHAAPPNLASAIRQWLFLEAQNRA